MTNVHDRKEYRKHFTSAGQLYIGGEILQFKSYDVSVKGIMIEVYPGKLLGTVEDFELLLKENDTVEIFVNDLMLAAEAKMVWVKQEEDKILMGLEYGDDITHNAKKLWLKRKSYRQKKPFSCIVQFNQQNFNVQGVNISVSGLALTGDLKASGIQKGDVVKLKFFGADVNESIAKVIWINENTDDTLTTGLRYIELG